ACSRPTEASAIIFLKVGDHIIEVALPTCRRVSLGLGRDGSISGNGSGDIFIAFSPAKPPAENGKKPATSKMLPLDAIFAATVQAVEESIINAMIAADHDRRREPQSDGITTRSI